MTVSKITYNVGAGGNEQATDLISGKDYPYGKLTGGAVDDATPIHAGQDVEANALNVTIASDTAGGVKHSDLTSGTQTNTDGVKTAVTAFGATASKQNCITSVTIGNSSTTYATVTLYDGNTTTEIYALPAPDKGGVTHNFDPPIVQPTPNTALYFQSDSAITTLTLSFNGYQA